MDSKKFFLGNTDYWIILGETDGDATDGRAVSFTTELDALTFLNNKVKAGARYYSDIDQELDDGPVLVDLSTIRVCRAGEMDPCAVIAPHCYAYELSQTKA